jgi:hypothetical protein
MPKRRQTNLAPNQPCCPCNCDQGNRTAAFVAITGETTSTYERKRISNQSSNSVPSCRQPKGCGSGEAKLTTEPMSSE